MVQGDDTLWPLPAGDDTVFVSVVSMGNPHAVQVVDDVDAAPVEETGPLIERHVRFPKRVNAGYLQVIDRHHLIRSTDDFRLICTPSLPISK